LHIAGPRVRILRIHAAGLKYRAIIAGDYAFQKPCPVDENVISPTGLIRRIHRHAAMGYNWFMPLYVYLWFGIIFGHLDRSEMEVEKNEVLQDITSVFTSKIGFLSSILTKQGRVITWRGIPGHNFSFF